MKHLHAIVISMFLFFTFISKFQAQNNHRSSMPYDIVFVGFDNDIGGVTSEKIGLLTMVDIYSGYTFGIINKLKDDLNWIAYNNDDLVQISFKLKNGFSYKRGSLLEIKILDGQISIVSNDKNVTSQFEISGLGHSSFEFIKNSGSFLTVHSGYFISSQSEFLLGTVLDIISIGVPRDKLLDLQLPLALNPKDIFTMVDPLYGAGNIDIHNCNICDIIFIILNPDNWNFTPGTPQDDIDLSDFNIEDCAEVDCEGELLLDVVDCTIQMTQNPCDSVPVSYEWQVKHDGIYITLIEGSNEGVPPFEISSFSDDDQFYRLIVECEDGCIYEKEIFVNCIIPDCEISLSVDTVGCQLTATVYGCENPIYNWNNIYMGSTSQAGNTQSITAENNGDYYIVVTGCCETKVSDYFNMDGCLDCDCSQILESDGCTILAIEEGCVGYVDIWQYSETGIDSTWQTINYHGNEYESTKNGFYRRILSKEGCNEIVNVIEVNCSEDCNTFGASAMINSECNIVIDYTGCTAVTSIGISYNSEVPSSECNSASNNGYFFGGGTVLENNDYGLSGEIIIIPDNENTCYQIALTCENGCEELVYIYNPSCCEGSLSITEEDCFIIADGIPCTGVFNYNWIINDTIHSTETDDMVPPLPIMTNGTYQLFVLCSDSCEYYSNEIFTDCFDPECESSVMIVPDGCLMTADITNCPDPIIQWQKWNGTAFVDLIGENGLTYLAVDDESIKVLITNCDNCEDEEPLSFEYTPMGCDDMCDCIVNVTLDEENCILTSEETGCSNILYSFWEQSNDNGITWFFVANAPFGSSYTPMENALYRKIIGFTDGCEPVYDEVNVNCLEDCSPSLTITLSITEDCNLKATWEGCASYVPEGFGWYFVENNYDNCTEDIIFPLSSPQVTDIIEIENNPANESGYIIVNAEFGEGCYFFNFQCDNCVVQQKVKWWEPCCDDDIPIIVETNTSDSICDYCWINANPHEILTTIVNLPDGTQLDLSTVTTNFTFPYCNITSCSNGNTISHLINDINIWLQDNNYEGEANPGPIGLCKVGTPYHVANTNVEFLNGDVFEDGGILNFSFTENDCSVINWTTLSVENVCPGAVYLWSTGETTQSIDITIDTELPIDVTITCPDSCVYQVEYGEENPARVAMNTEDEFQSIYEVSKTEVIEDNLNDDEYSRSKSSNLNIYPNPTRNEFYIEVINVSAKYIDLKILNTQGKLVKKKSMLAREDQRYIVDTESMKSGMYFIWVEAEGETIGYKKLIVIK